MLFLIKAFNHLNGELGILILCMSFIHENVVYKFAYKHLQKALSFQTMSLWPNLFMHFETEDSACLRLH